MQVDEEYLKRVKENKEVLKRLNADLDSWEGAEKKELQLKLKECSHLLKEWNASSVDHVALAFARQFMDRIQALENKADLEVKINSSQKLLKRIEDETEFMKRTAEYNENVLNKVKVANLSNTLQNLSLDSSNGASILGNVSSTLQYEKIKEHIKKIKEQEAEIKELSSQIKTLY